jgi:hypothetical protein
MAMKKHAVLYARPCTLKQANELVGQIHRHHKPVQGHRFSIAAYLHHRYAVGDLMNELVGVAIVGRPVGRMVDQYDACEVTRLATNGTKNACSFLYAKCARAAEAMGFEFIQTYTLESEPGTSLRAAGWDCDGVVRKNGVGWNNRKGRRDDQPTETKVRWRKRFVRIDLWQRPQDNG